VPGLWALGVGCAVGLAMNYFSWKLREAVSATTVTVIGNICKFITILANILIWDQHSGGGRLICTMCTTQLVLECMAVFCHPISSKHVLASF
jgi:hypothetical protein